MRLSEPRTVIAYYGKKRSAVKLVIKQNHLFVIPKEETVLHRKKKKSLKNKTSFGKIN